MSWKEVIEYTFLSDFDILRDPKGNAALRPWATPAARQLMDAHYKIQRAKEEIARLDIEIRRFVTYMKDEKEFLTQKEQEVRAVDPTMAFFVRRYRHQRGRFDEVHMKRLLALEKKLGTRFTGTLIPGTRRVPVVAAVASTQNAESDQMEDVVESTPQEAFRDGPPLGDRDSDDDESDDDWVDDDGDDDGDVGEIADGEALAEVLEGVGIMTMDGDGDE